MTIGRSVRLAGAVLFAVVMTGCASTQPYKATPDNNVRFTTAVESGSWTSSVQASAHIHSVDHNCQTDYKGTIPLGQSTIVTGVPAGRPSYLVLAFNSSSFLANRRSSINYGTMLTPRRGYDYEVAVRYVDDTYNATIREVNRRSQAQRELHHKPLETCRARG